MAHQFYVYIIIIINSNKVCRVLHSLIIFIWAWLHSAYLQLQIILENAIVTNDFTTFFYKLLMWWMIINKWKNNVNDEPRWEPRIIDHINSI